MELRRRRRRPVVALADGGSWGAAGGGAAGEAAHDEPVDEGAVSPEERAETGVMAAWTRDLLEE
jgi:hypothetical protein